MNKLFLILFLIGCVFPAEVRATVLNFTGFESDNSDEAQSGTGTFSYVTSPVHAGTYALKVNPTTSAVGNVRIAKMSAAGVPTTTMAVADLYQSFYFYLDTAPATLNEEILVVLSTSSTQKASVRVDSNKNLSVYTSSDALSATGTTVLSLSTWYRIDFHTATGSGNQPYELRINGTSELSGTMSQGTNNNGSVRLGKSTNQNSKSVVYYYDDWSADDTAYPNAQTTIALIPSGDGTTQQWTLGTNASNYLEVDEIPTDGDTTYIAKGAINTQIALVNFTDTGAAGITGTVNALKLYISTRDSVGTAASFARISSNAVTADTSSTATGTSYIPLFNLSLTDPNTSAAWTLGGVDAVQGGIVDTAAISTVRCSSIIMMVNSTAAVVNTVNTLAALGVGG